MHLSQLGGEELAFVRAVADGPGDLLPRLAYADYLEDCGDPRGEFLRLATKYAVQFLHYDDRAATVTRLVELGKQIDPVWRTAFEPAPRVFITAREVTLPLRQVTVRGPWPFWNPLDDPFPAYVYAVSVNHQSVRVVGRMRFSRLARRDGAPVAVGVEGTSGEPAPVPAAWVHDWHYRSPTKAGWIRQRVVPPGTVQNPARFYPLNVFDPATAFRFDCLLNGWFTS